MVQDDCVGVSGVFGDFYLNIPNDTARLAQAFVLRLAVVVVAGDVIFS